MSESQAVVDDLAGHPDVVTPDSIQAVIISGTVLLQIAKHASDLSSLANAIPTGLLLGFDANDVLDVTYSHPLQTTTPSGDEPELSPTDFQKEMLGQLRATGVHANYCGWYRGASLEDLPGASLVSYHADFQKDKPNSVVVLYDHFKATKGLLSLRAFRLSSAFMAMYAQALSTFDGKKQDDGNPVLARTKFFEHKISSADIFEEIPIKIQNPLLLHAQLYELREDKLLSSNPERLDLNNAAILKNLRRLEDTIDEYVSDQSSYLFYQKKLVRAAQDRENFVQQRRTMGDPVAPDEFTRHPMFKDPPAPSRLNSFLISNQLRESADQVADLANLGFAKLYAIQAVTKNTAR
eukprot:TRINITY_DN5885_c0_g2_i1.p1 TRINITY_DN5885_c0_g2~~TRINITY_DN5885_c0_g2_i1.p1  ORF type:complete len:351 (-),score=77.99 TRINITY_DN5885_c0_g2_i1:349-1401(-)